jgi:hypothetical protein
VEATKAYSSKQTNRIGWLVCFSRTNGARLGASPGQQGLLRPNALAPLTLMRFARRSGLGLFWVQAQTADFFSNREAQQLQHRITIDGRLGEELLSDPP